jgi:DNA replication protein DnaC
MNKAAFQVWGAVPEEILYDRMRTIWTGTDDRYRCPAGKQRYLKTRLQLAHLPCLRTFDRSDFAFQPSIDERQIRELRMVRFVHEAPNVILLGPPGVGKTHLAVLWRKPRSSPAKPRTS